MYFKNIIVYFKPNKTFLRNQINYLITFNERLIEYDKYQSDIITT